MHKKLRENRAKVNKVSVHAMNRYRESFRESRFLPAQDLQKVIFSHLNKTKRVSLAPGDAIVYSTNKVKFIIVDRTIVTIIHRNRKKEND